MRDADKLTGSSDYGNDVFSKVSFAAIAAAAAPARDAENRMLVSHWQCLLSTVGSTGGRNTSIFDEMGVEAMKRRQRIYYTAAQRSEIWDRWQRGESM
ncbi:hypothetical protein, partial [Allosphingosinicella sp.]|uniref:hypothetical protein n=1 Tax=Allosphingosinicella sp. TaxID=2823234 RepID=UPI002FC0FBEE